MHVSILPNRDLLDPNFDSYKLSLRTTSIFSTSEPNEIDFTTICADNFSRLEIQLFSMHNALFQDRFDQETFYYFTKNGQLKGSHITSRSDSISPGSVVFQLPGWNSVGANPSKCNASAKLLSDFAVICDGARGLFLLTTPARIERKFSTWTAILQHELPSSNASYYLNDAVKFHTSNGEARIDVLLLSIASRSSRMQKHEVFLDWITFTENTGGNWSVTCHRQFSGQSVPEYAVFEQQATSILLCTSSPFVASSGGPAGENALLSTVENCGDYVALSEPSAGSSTRIVWTQTFPKTPSNGDDNGLVNILVHLGDCRPSCTSVSSAESLASPNGRAKDAFRVSCVSCAPDSHAGFSLQRLVIEVLQTPGDGEASNFMHLCNARLFAPVIIEDTMWTYDYETNSLDITLVKSTPAAWLRLFVDLNEEARLHASYDDSEFSGSDDRLLAQSNCEKMQGVFNVEQLEDVDMIAEPGNDYLILQRIDSETLKTSLQAELLGCQWLYNAPLLGSDNSAFGTPASELLCVRHDVDGLLWSPNPSGIKSDSTAWLHVATLQAFGYVIASKRSRRFVASPPANLKETSTSTRIPFVAVSDVSKHVYVYWQPLGTGETNGDDVCLSPNCADTELRHRSANETELTSRVVHVAWQQMISLPNADEIIGFFATTKPLPALVVATKQHLFLICL